VFQTQRLSIKPWTPSDAPAFLALSQDEGFNRYPINQYRQPSLEGARNWILQNPHKYAVSELATGQIIGMGGLTPWQWEGESLVDITYRLHEKAWGKGLGMELAQGLLSYGFEQLKLPEITATITPDNFPSIKIALRLGMRLDRRILLKGIPTDLYRLARI
jgi:[ribosomal protein S5]-alanine N-acetyltransferase